MGKRKNICLCALLGSGWPSIVGPFLCHLSFCYLCLYKIVVSLLPCFGGITRFDPFWDEGISAHLIPYTHFKLVEHLLCEGDFVFQTEYLLNFPGFISLRFEFLLLFCVSVCVCPCLLVCVCEVSVRVYMFVYVWVCLCLYMFFLCQCLSLCVLMLCVSSKFSQQKESYCKYY